jgi:hypothetical protein
MIQFISDALAEMRFDVFTADKVVKRLTQPSSELERWTAAILESFADHGYQGYQWATYVDLEILWAVRQVLDWGDQPQSVIQSIDRQMDMLPDGKYGLIGSLRLLDPRWPEELPIRPRLVLLRSIAMQCMPSPNKLAKLPQIVYPGLGGLLDSESCFVSLVEWMRSSRGHISAPSTIERYSELLASLTTDLARH